MHVLALALCLFVPLQEKGRLVVAGGGTTTADITKRTLELAGGAAATVLVIPQASESSDGKASAEMWKVAGAKEAAILDLADPKKAVAQVEKASLIWIPGGDQARLMEKLAGTGVPGAIQKRFEAGGVVGGTSAGAAVMSKTMIAGPGAAKGLQKGAAKFADGLGLWPEVMVDQHFVARDRFARLYSAVLEKPALLGVGIDESTAVVVNGSSIEVIGRSNVVVLDARKAKITLKDGEPPSATGVTTHILKPGDTFDLGDCAKK